MRPELFVDVLSYRHRMEKPMVDSHPENRPTFGSTLRNEERERTFELGPLGEFDATGLLLSHEGLQSVGGQSLPQSQLF